jgi:hypothetical protein
MSATSLNNATATQASNPVNIYVASSAASTTPATVTGSSMTQQQGQGNSGTASRPEVNAKMFTISERSPQLIRTLGTPPAPTTTPIIATTAKSGSSSPSAQTTGPQGAPHVSSPSTNATLSIFGNTGPAVSSAGPPVTLHVPPTSTHSSGGGLSSPLGPNNERSHPLSSTVGANAQSSIISSTVSHSNAAAAQPSSFSNPLPLFTSADFPSTYTFPFASQPLVSNQDKDKKIRFGTFHALMLSMYSCFTIRAIFEKLCESVNTICCKYVRTFSSSMKQYGSLTEHRYNGLVNFVTDPSNVSINGIRVWSDMHECEPQFTNIMREFFVHGFSAQIPRSSENIEIMKLRAVVVQRVDSSHYEYVSRFG